MPHEVQENCRKMQEKNKERGSSSLLACRVALDVVGGTLEFKRLAETLTGTPPSAVPDGAVFEIKLLRSMQFRLFFPLVALDNAFGDRKGDQSNGGSTNN